MAKKKATAKTDKATKAAKKKTAKKKAVSGAVMLPKSPQSFLQSMANRINARNKELPPAGEFLSDLTSWCSTTCVPLDVTLWGGVPRGRIVDIHGDPSNGKSSLMEAVLLGNQRANGVNMLVMSEACIDTRRMERSGLSMDNVLPVHPMSFEEGVFAIEDALQERMELQRAHPDWCALHPLVIAWDTPSNAQERHIMEDPTEQFAAGMASKARNVRSALRSITPLAARTNTLILLLFQTHVKIGTQYYGAKDTDCGGGPKFSASLRIWARYRDKLFTPTMDDTKIGIISEYTIVKSKAGCPPYRSVELPIRSYDGLDNDLAMFNFLRNAWLTDPCTVCGGKVPDPDGHLVWASEAWKTCEACNRTGKMFHLVDTGNGAAPTYIAVEGKSSSGNATQWRYIYGWPNEEKITFKDSDIREAFDSRPGLRTWLAQKCWELCTKPEPAVFHPVE